MITAPSASPCFNRRVASLWGMAVLLTGFAMPGFADQSDPRLGALFARLQEATNPMTARTAEREIWSIWHETPDEESLEIMIAAYEGLQLEI